MVSLPLARLFFSPAFAMSFFHFFQSLGLTSFVRKTLKTS